MTDFAVALASVKRGESFVYHTGLLMRDRQTDSALHVLATTAWGSYEDGRVHLVQRRVSEGACEYRAVRR